MANGRKPYDKEDRNIRISRSALEEAMRCPRCYYQDRRLGLKRPSGPSFTLNNAVDSLLKLEMEVYREDQVSHPVMERFAPELELVPMQEPRLEEWRSVRKGVTANHAPSGFVLAGAIDDLWLSRATGLAHVADFKAAGSNAGSSLDGPYRAPYKRQLDVYTYLLSRNGLPMSETAFFLFALADRTGPAFDGVLQFTEELVAYKCDTSWIEPALMEVRTYLDADETPAASTDCEWCKFTIGINQN